MRFIRLYLKVRLSKIFLTETTLTFTGRKTGLVTNTRITHATPSATYAHVPDRKFEYEIPSTIKDRSQCKDIASQFVEDTDFNVSLCMLLCIKT